MQLKTLKARVDRADYVVDPPAVADAIVRRLVEARRRAQFPVVPEREQAGRREARAISGDVLEAG